MNMYPMNPNNMYGNGLYNPYVTPINQFNPVVPNYQPVITQNAPHREIDRVNGRDGALALPMGPNSSAIAADTILPKIWVITTDSAGFKTVVSMTVTPDEEPEQTAEAATDEEQQKKEDEKDAQIKALTERLDKLEERMRKNGQPDSRAGEQNKSNNAAVRQDTRTDTVTEPNAGAAANGRTK